MHLQIYIVIVMPMPAMFINMKMIMEKKIIRYYVFVTNCLFSRGYYDLDPYGYILTNTTYYPPSLGKNNLNYRFALDILEAVQFNMLHEYYHFRGANDEGMADNYAIRTIRELRKQKWWGTGNFEKLPYSSPNKSTHCDKYHGLHPNLSNLPYGME